VSSLVDEVALGNTRTGNSSSTVSCRYQCTLCYHTVLVGVASLTWKLPAAVSHLHRGNEKKVDKLAFCNIFFNHEHTQASFIRFSSSHHWRHLSCDRRPPSASSAATSASLQCAQQKGNERPKCLCVALLGCAWKLSNAVHSEAVFGRRLRCTADWK
jgi:hypothetical protein